MIREFEANDEERQIIGHMRRHEQTRDWFHSMITDHLIDSFYKNATRKAASAFT